MGQGNSAPQDKTKVEPASVAALIDEIDLSDAKTKLVDLDQHTRMCGTRLIAGTQARKYQDLFSSLKKLNFNYENLVMEGGGVKCLAEVGAAITLERYGVWGQFKRFAGSSGGAIAAALFAAKKLPSEVATLMLELDFESMMDKNGSIITQAVWLFKKGGVCRGDVMEEWLIKLFGKTTTLKQLYESTENELVITAYSTRKLRTLYLSYKTMPDMPVYLAVKASCSMPFAFARVPWQGDELWDGGVLSNFPIWVFNHPDCLPDDSYRLKPLNKKTLGINIVEDDAQQPDGIIYYHDAESISGLQPIINLVRAFREQIDRRDPAFLMLSVRAQLYVVRFGFSWQVVRPPRHVELHHKSLLCWCGHAAN